MKKNKVSAILLAAGLSHRMGTDKLLFEYNAKSLLQHSIDLISKLSVHQQILVTTRARAGAVTIPPQIGVHINPNPRSGQSGSIRIGIKEATGTHYLFLTADQPLLTLEDISQLMEQSQKNPDKIIFPQVMAKPCSPTIFPARFRNDLLNLTDDKGGRIIRDKNPDFCCGIDITNPENCIDIDYLEDYNGLTNRPQQKQNSKGNNRHDK